MSEQLPKVSREENRETSRFHSDLINHISQSGGIEFGRGVTDTEITYIALRNSNGTKCYLYPNAAGTGITVTTVKP